MAATRMRPGFELELPAPADQVGSRLQLALAADDPTALTSSGGGWAELLVPEAERRLWSPHLSVEIEDAGGRTRLRGRFAPRSDVWTLVMFIYFLMGFAAILGTILGYVQWTMDSPAWGFWVVPPSGGIILLLHAASRVGQRLAADQMGQLRARLDDALRRAFPELGP